MAAASAAKLISARLVVCPACGREARVVASTSLEVVSRCYACGDVTRTPSAVRPVWSAEAAVREAPLTAPDPAPSGDEEPLAAG